MEGTTRDSNERLPDLENHWLVRYTCTGITTAPLFKAINAATG